MQSSEENKGSYAFDITALAVFTFDYEIAKKEYRSEGLRLAQFIAANITRIVYSGARELLAAMTSRAPFGTAMLDSLLIEPKDISIGSEADPKIILREIFRVPPEEIEKLGVETGTQESPKS
jgi:hypothetical protein